jgi:hypothetical protein
MGTLYDFRLLAPRSAAAQDVESGPGRVLGSATLRRGRVLIEGHRYLWRDVQAARPAQLCGPLGRPASARLVVASETHLARMVVLLNFSFGVNRRYVPQPVNDDGAEPRSTTARPRKSD